MSKSSHPSHSVVGEFINIGHERYYAIRHVDQMPPFFISLVSGSDHWLFLASTGGLTAGRVSPENALFPYVPVDRIYESSGHTGSKTLLHVSKNGQDYAWEPYNKDFNHGFRISQNLYKNVLGDKICFEEINHDLQLAFRYSWKTSDEYGFCRQCELTNLDEQTVSVQMIDGLQNILPAGTPRITQTVSSNLVDAYKWNELDQGSGLAMFTVYSGITDRAQPSESLRANTVFSLGFDNPQILLSNQQLEKFRRKEQITSEATARGMRGAYLVHVDFELAANQVKSWQIVANLERSQAQVSQLIQRLSNLEQLTYDIEESIAKGSDSLAKIMASADGFQVTNQELDSVHHYANTLFNTLRGGIFDQHHFVSIDDFIQTLHGFNYPLFKQHQAGLTKLEKRLTIEQFTAAVNGVGDKQLQRLAAEYLPVTFGRRHGDPSRPWNQFEVKLKDSKGNRLLSYQGNWRDIFQNWEALCFSYPEFTESVISKFVNASTIDGYNPYRITKSGIDWEVEEPEDPWSFIGYWGDHQIIYLLKMLELSHKFHPQKLAEWLHQDLFCYANVPYRITSFQNMLKEPKHTVTFDEEAALSIKDRVNKIGADGKLLLDKEGNVYQVNLLEKLLVPLLCKLANLVIEGGIWLNTQRPEWNDANNALVGNGLSVVTLNYLRRYVAFLQHLLTEQHDDALVSYEVFLWLADTHSVLEKLPASLNTQPVTPQQRFDILTKLGEAAWRYRSQVYQNMSFSSKTPVTMDSIKALLNNALVVIDHSIQSNVKSDGLFHAYNLLQLNADQPNLGTASVRRLYPMLEGQVAVLSSGGVSAQQTIDVVESLFASDIYREDANTFMLYPDRPQTGFLVKNTLCLEQLKHIPTLLTLVNTGDKSLIEQDVQGVYRFNPDIKNRADLEVVTARLLSDKSLSLADTKKVEDLYEQTFNHQAFTGRSGGMFGFEGLGCVYWHMVSKLLLAVNENFYRAIEQQEPSALIKRLGELYYQIREGIGFNKSPIEYGAFPCDPYSHTPKHAGAQQPGMTGQVKEEILTRFGELGIHVEQGQVRFAPKLLRQQEFTTVATEFKYLDIQGAWQQLNLAAQSLAFTWCQVPIIYQLTSGKPHVTIIMADGNKVESEVISLDPYYSQLLFSRTGKIESIYISLTVEQLLI